MIQDKEFERLMAQEDLILEVTEAFCDILKAEKVKKRTLAEMLGKTKGFISQILSGGRNLTLRTMADMAFSLGYAIEFKFVRRVKSERRDSFKLMWEVDQKSRYSFGALNIPDEYDPPSCDLSGARVAA